MSILHVRVMACQNRKKQQLVNVLLQQHLCCHAAVLHNIIVWNNGHINQRKRIAVGHPTIE